MSNGLPVLTIEGAREIMTTPKLADLFRAGLLGNATVLDGFDEGSRRTIAKEIVPWIAVTEQVIYLARERMDVDPLLAREAAGILQNRPLERARITSTDASAWLSQGIDPEIIDVGFRRTGIRRPYTDDIGRNHFAQQICDQGRAWLETSAEDLTAYQQFGDREVGGGYVEEVSRTDEQILVQMRAVGFTDRQVGEVNADRLIENNFSPDFWSDHRIFKKFEERVKPSQRTVALLDSWHPKGIREFLIQFCAVIRRNKGDEVLANLSSMSDANVDWPATVDRISSSLRISPMDFYLLALLYKNIKTYSTKYLEKGGNSLYEGILSSADIVASLGNEETRRTAYLLVVNACKELEVRPPALDNQKMMQVLDLAQRAVDSHIRAEVYGESKFSHIRGKKDSMRTLAKDLMKRARLLIDDFHDRFQKKNVGGFFPGKKFIDLDSRDFSN